MKTKRMDIDLDKDTMKALSDEADMQGRSRKRHVEVLLKEYVSRTWKWGIEDKK